MNKGKQQYRCENCEHYKVACDGEKMFKQKKTTYSSESFCENYTNPPVAINPIQVEAFHSLYRVKRRGGMDNLMAFVEAVVQTSDDVWESVKDNKAGLIDRLNERIQGKGRRKNLSHEEVDGYLNI